MGGAYHSNAEPSSSSSLTLESFYGIKGTLHLVPQGTTQKPHIILRRECSAGDGAESSSVAGKARFSLVANKRFTISKGHPLSFGIVDPKGNDEVKPLNGESSFTLEFDYDDELHSRRDFESLPAKMRKSLTGTKTFDTFAEKQSQNALGFPGYPYSIPEMRVFASSSVQTDPIELREISASPATRTPSPLSLTKGRDKYPPRVYPSPISTVDHPTEESLFADTSTHLKENELDNDAATDRSSSSMDLSTPPSLNNSPVILPSSLAPELLDDTAILPADSGAVDVGLGVPESFSLQAPEEISSVRKLVTQGTGEDETKKTTIVQTHLPTRRVQEISPQGKTLTEPQALKSKPKLSGLLSDKLPPKPGFPTSTQAPTPDFRKLAATREVLPSMPRAMSQRIGNGVLLGSGSTSSLALVSSSPTTTSSPAVSCTHGNRNGATTTSVPRSTLAPNGFLPTKPQVPNIPTPHPTISNPLGIKPSASMLPKPPPTGPKSLLASATTTINASTQPPTSNGAATARTVETMLTRKPVVVSASWSALRGSAPLGNVNPATTRPSGSKSIPTVTKTTTPEERLSLLSANPNLSVLLRYSASPPRGTSASDSTSAGTLPGFVPATNYTNLQASSESSVDAGARNGIVQGDTKGKWKRIAEEECPPLKRPRSEASQGKEPVTANITKGDPQQPRKKVKTEASELQGETSLVSSSSTVTSCSSRNIDMSVDESTGQSKVDDNGLHGKIPPSARRRERRKKRRALNSVSLYGDQGTTGDEQSEKEEPEKVNMGQISSEFVTKGDRERVETESKDVQRKEKEREVAGKVAREKEERVSAASVPLAQKYPQPPRLTHPLPPKPKIPMTSSSYRPQIKRERERSRGPDQRWSRSRSRSRSRGSPSRSRSRGRTRERSRSRSSRRDLSVTDKRAKVSEPLGTQGRDSVTPLVKEALFQGPITAGNATWPITTPNMVHQIQGTRPIAVRQILFASDGKRVGIVCSDRTIRLWDTKPRIAEAAKLLHGAQIVTMNWMEYDKGVLTLCDDGSVNTWMLQGKEWQHNRLFHLQSPSSSGPVAMAYRKDRIAVSTASCVKVWLLYRGVWQPQREIKRSGVTALCFHLYGGLFGGCQDGTLWYCEVPNGTLRAYYLIANHWMITSIDVHPNGIHVLAGQKGAAYLLTHEPNTIKGKLDNFYVTPGPPPVSGNEGANYSSLFATNGHAVVSGLIKGCALVWDRKKGNIVYGLRHPHDDTVQAIAVFDGQPGVEGMMVSGTKSGRLLWWPVPQAARAGSGQYPFYITSDSRNPH